MRTVLFLVQKEFLQIFRNKTMLVLLLIMPVLQTILLSYAANYEVKNLALAVVDHDLSPASRQLAAKFSASGYFKVKQTTFATKEADHAMANDRVDIILEIPAHFERDLVRENHATVSLVANAINATKAGLGMGYAQNIVRDFNIEFAEKWMARTVSTAPATAEGGGYATAPSTVQITYSNWYNPKLDYKTFMVPGILGEIVALIIGFLTALNIVREREIGTIEQLNVTPVQKWQFILGKLLPFWLLSLVMMTVGLAAGKLMFDIPMVGNLGLVFLYTATFTPCMLGFGFFISNFSDSQQQATFTVWFFLLIFILMCGLFTPVESMPQWAQWLNVLNPIQYFVEFMRLVLLKGADFQDIKTNYFSVLTYAIAVNGLAVWSYKKRA
ncbi:MAG: ABC transporter permease [Haliscomenobacteraceae bacterium CHB4]|nr:putative multidrug ABC transporter permease YbhR [Saprospiraceae bacterium]MCE7922655.1 ABC transporter permease [Haliscomenobacteraceae bacterium CHB4]